MNTLCRSSSIWRRHTTQRGNMEFLKHLSDMGLRGRLPIFISQFLTDRHFKVGSTLSDSHEQEMGVPQGSILSPTLFSIKINSLARVLNQGVEGSLYVDDLLICYRAKNMNNIERQLQLNLNKIEKWASENGFKFSIAKTVGMHFCKKTKLHPDPELKIYGKPIKIVKETKFLGLIFDSKRSFIPHMAAYSMAQRVTATLKSWTQSTIRVSG